MHNYREVAQNARQDNHFAKSKWLLDYYFVHSNNSNLDAESLEQWLEYADVCRELGNLQGALDAVDKCLEYEAENQRIWEKKLELLDDLENQPNRSVNCGNERISRLLNNILPCFLEVDVPVKIITVKAKEVSYDFGDMFVPQIIRTMGACQASLATRVQITLRIDMIDFYNLTDEAVIGLLAREFSHWALRHRQNIMAIIHEFDTEVRKYAAEEVSRIMVEKATFEKSEILTNLLVISKGYAYELDCLYTALKTTGTMRLGLPQPAMHDFGQPALKYK